MLAVVAVLAIPRPAEAFLGTSICFSFSIGNGPRYTFLAPQGMFGPWIGPLTDNGFYGVPGAGCGSANAYGPGYQGLGYPGSSGYGFPGSGYPGWGKTGLGYPGYGGYGSSYPWGGYHGSGFPVGGFPGYGGTWASPYAMSSPWGNSWQSPWDASPLEMGVPAGGLPWGTPWASPAGVPWSSFGTPELMSPLSLP